MGQKNGVVRSDVPTHDGMTVVVWLDTIQKQMQWVIFKKPVLHHGFMCQCCNDGL